MTTENYRLYDRTGGNVRQDIYAVSLSAAIAAGIKWIEGGSWPGEGGSLECEVSVIVRDSDGEIDDEATHCAERHDCSGVDHIVEPSCSEDAHDWVRVGGCSENPGVFSSGHGQICTVERCSICGATMTVDHGATDSSGRCTTTTTYENGGAA